MKKLPQRPRSHVLEEESLLFVKQTLPKEWIIEETQNDYGVDLAIEIVENNEVTGAHFLIQLKSTDRLVINRKGFISHPCNTSTLQYFLERPELVIYLVYDSINGVGYWVWVQDFLRNQFDSDWKKQKTFTVKISKDNILSEDTVKKIKNRVLRNHQKEKLVNTIGTINHPGIKYGLEFTENTTVITASPKYPGAEKEHPIKVDLKFNFGDSVEGKQAYLAWEEVFKKGVGTKIDARFVEEVKFSDPVTSEFFREGNFKLSEITVQPLKREIKFATKVLLLDSQNETITQIPFVEFQEVMPGSEEALFTNDHQNIPYKISLYLNILERTLNIKFNLKLLQMNPYQVKEALLVQKALWMGCLLKIVEVNAGINIFEYKFPPNTFPEPSKSFIEVVEKLAFVQEKIGKILLVPEKVSNNDMRLLNQIVEIVTTGQVIKKAKFVRFKIDRDIAQQLADGLSEHGKLQFLFEEPNNILNLFGNELSLGKIRFLLNNCEPSSETIKLLSSLSTLPNDEIIEIKLNIHEPGITIQYLDWLPKTKNGE